MSLFDIHVFAYRAHWISGSNRIIFSGLLTSFCVVLNRLMAGVAMMYRRVSEFARFLFLFALQWF